jgi:hypothetical protein
MKQYAMIGHGSEPTSGVFYGWWIVAAAFLNLFFSVGIIFYGFPVFYPPHVTATLGFTRAQVEQGFLLGFVVVGIPFSLLAGVLIDWIGARWVILVRSGLHRHSPGAHGVYDSLLAI